MLSKAHGQLPPASSEGCIPQSFGHHCSSRVGSSPHNTWVHPGLLVNKAKCGGSYVRGSVVACNRAADS